MVFMDCKAHTQVMEWKTHSRHARPPFECIALLLQGGGALGAYQGGVYQALAERHLDPDWIAGISIGAINAALIAGNSQDTRVECLRRFWELVTCASPLDGMMMFEPRPSMQGEVARGLLNRVSASATALVGVPGFFAPRFPTVWLQPAGSVAATSYYDTTQLKSTLERLIDFDRINSGEMRFSVGAVNVSTGNFVYFDNTTHIIAAEHVMASGALPPGFPAIEIEGEFYWDGGLVSNTPLQWVLERDDSSDGFRRDQKLRHALSSLIEKLPEELQNAPELEVLRPAAHPAVYNIVQLIYRAKGYEGDSKDYEFSRQSMEEHWGAGYYDTARTLRHSEVLRRPQNLEGVLTFDLGQNGRE